VTPADYLSLTAAERDLILLREHWQFAGDRRDLPDHLDSLAISLAGVPVLLVNDQGTIRAFINSCRHRGSELRAPGKGHGALVCPYHGWSFRPDGILAGVPRAETFPDHPLCRRQHTSLHNLGLLVVGDLLFVRLAGEEDPQVAQETAGWIEPQSRLAGRLIHTAEFSVAANWKVVMENGLEGYHAPLVHRTTFTASMPGGHDQYAFVGKHSEGAGGTESNAQNRWNRLLALIPQRPFPDQIYRQRMVFPNTFLWSFYGCILGITTAIPTGPATCQVRVRIYVTEAGSGAPATAEAMLEAMSRIMVELFAKVQGEDNVICESQQRGVTGARDVGVLGRDEIRVAAFRALYDELAASTAAQVSGVP
jgi:choline monooxygenase